MKALTAIEFPYLNLKDKFNYLIHLGFLKRVTFSEYLTERCEELAENDNELDIQEFGMINNDFDMLFSGYARQPFRPEMITQLFEGWLYNPITELFEALNDKMYDQIQFGSEYMYCITLSFEVSATIPTTLNDFISDANRAGIELNFKENI